MGHARTVEPLAHRGGHVDGEVAHHEFFEVRERLPSGEWEIGLRPSLNAAALFFAAEKVRLVNL